jgi:hypothetical protein
MIKNLFELNPTLAWLGAVHFVIAAALLVYYPFNDTIVLGINSVIKPIKFALSIGIYAWTMALILPYIASEKQIYIYSIMAVGVMGYEQLVITIQAMRGCPKPFQYLTCWGCLIWIDGLGHCHPNHLDARTWCTLILVSV